MDYKGAVVLSDFFAVGFRKLHASSKSTILTDSSLNSLAVIGLMEIGLKCTIGSHGLAAAVVD